MPNHAHFVSPAPPPDHDGVVSFEEFTRYMAAVALLGEPENSPDEEEDVNQPRMRAR